MAQTAVQNDFSKGSLWRIILNQSVPLMVAQLVHVLYNVVDRVYLGHLPGASSLALTGVGLIFPIVALVSAFCALFSTGGAPLCAIARGAGEKERAEKLLNNTFSMLLIMAVLMTAAGYLFRKPILYLFGASNDTYAYANDYLKIYLAGTAFSMITTGMNGFINLQGFPKVGMMTTLLGAVLNVILDPIFIFAFDMGVKGAALATVISQAVSALWVLQFLLGKKAILRIRLRYMRPEGKLLKEITTLGIPGFIMSGTNCLVQVTCNATLGLWGGDVYIGVMTVINSIREIFTIPLTGLTQGAQPVISFNYGAKEYDRVRRGIVILSVASISVTTVCWILILLFPRPVLSLFSNDTALVDVGVRCVRQYFLGFFLQSLQFAGQHSFVALGKSKQAIFFSLLRKVVIVFPLTLLLPHLGGLGVSGVFLAEPVSNLLGGTSCFVTMLLTVWPMLKREEQKLLEQPKA
ncbi:MAG: MATE family efflux transporter [Oscillospiraceae bacterium]|nr:MATE family efflux transporter [Oscillospiraceae bacterium]